MNFSDKIKSISEEMTGRWTFTSHSRSEVDFVDCSATRDDELFSKPR